MAPILALPSLVILVFIGLAFLWLVHHHLWKPLMGILLVGAGLFFFSLLGFRAERAGVERQMMTDQTDQVQSAELRHETAVSSAEIPAAPDKPRPTNSQKPAWVGQPPHIEGNDGLYVVSVTSGPYQTLAECDAPLTAAIEKEVRAYAEKKFDFDLPTGPLSLDSIRPKLVRKEYQETVESSFGPMQQLDAELTFTKEVQTELLRQVRQFVINHRLKYAAAAAGTVLLMLGGAYSFLRRPQRTPEGSKPLAGG